MKSTRIIEIDPLTGEILDQRQAINIYPASHFVTPVERIESAVKNIEVELDERIAELEREGKLLETQRLLQRTHFDLEMLRETGHCKGIENYSRHLDGRNAGDPSWTLLDYFPKDFLMFIDESHVGCAAVARHVRRRPLPQAGASGTMASACPARWTTARSCSKNLNSGSTR